MSNQGGPNDSPITLRIVATSAAGLPGDLIELGDGPFTFGRGDTNAVVLEDTSVSRNHARLERTEAGLDLIDLGSSNGTWLGDQRVERVSLEPGTEFRIGSTVFAWIGAETESAPEPEDFAERTMMFEPGTDLASLIQPPPREEGFELSIVISGDLSKRGTVQSFARRFITIGRSDECHVALDDEGISRRHAKIEVLSKGFLATDLGSTNGVWIGGERITAPTKFGDGDRVRIGTQTEVECTRSDASDEDGADFDGTMALTMMEQLASDDFQGTVCIPIGEIPSLGGGDLKEEGELLEISSTEPFVADDAESVWIVESGGIELFAVGLDERQATGPRSHFLSILEGQCFFGLDTVAQGLTSGFLAVARPGTNVRKMSAARFRQLSETPQSRAQIVELLDAWVRGLSASLMRDIPEPDDLVSSLTVGEETTIARGQRITTEDDVVWIEIWSGSQVYVDMAIPTFSARTVPFPIAAGAWIETTGDEFDDLGVRPRTTADAIEDPDFWQGLGAFQEAVCECEFINKRLMRVDEYMRLQDKAMHAQAAGAAGYDAIGAVLRTEAERPATPAGGGAEPLLNACVIVGDHLGFEVKNHPAAGEFDTLEGRLDAIARASGCRTRVVALDGDWYKRDGTAMVGVMEETGDPLALLPLVKGGFEYIDPVSGARAALDPEFAARISSFAHTIYAPFPEGEVTLRNLMSFAIRGLVPDFKLLGVAGALIGVLGAVTPWVTGQFFDRVIPDADVSMGLLWGGAIAGAAVGTFFFKIAQGIATIRLQGRMEYSVQAALWDRLMDLPTGFFRDYSSGDLADRAMGIDRIQQLVSGSGISAILGTFSGLFYVVVMLMYNIQLAMVGVGLTALYVGVTMLGNYRQITYQRQEIAKQGFISGLVLNLVTGVNKLRVSGAENHAFRTWAQAFAEQRKLAFAAGRIQNLLTVYNDAFPLASSMLIFWFMVRLAGQAAESGQQGLSTGEFIAFNASFGAFLMAMQALGDASLNMVRILPVYERLKPILMGTPEVDSAKMYPGQIEGEIELSKLSFRYTPDGPWIIKDLSLMIEAGEFVALVGGSGSGKSTLLRLMLGFETPGTGSVYYDGQDLENIDVRMLRQQLGVVMQQSKVLPTDIHRNIVGTTSRTLDEAWEAAEMAGFAEDIRAMPMEMHTYVSEGGGTLSGGQRQRLMICRAIVNKPNVLFMDEATSALDNAAQAKVTASVNALGATRIVIAHRLSTIQDAHKICYLEKGTIAEMGTYDELMALDGYFAALAKRQMV